MKQVRGFIIIAGMALMLHACGGAETKIDPEVTNVDPDTVEVQTEERVPTAEPRSGTVVNPDLGNEKNEILRNIDKHLVSSQTASDRISVENKLSDADFQRVIVEVSEMDASGKPTRTNFYQIVNLDAGSTKVVKIPPITEGANIEIHIIKAKSDALTGGAMILVGSRYSPDA
jgi:hypothetical protein